MNHTEPTPKRTPSTTEDRANQITKAYRDYSGSNAAAVEANDYLVSTFATRLARSLPDMDAKTLGEACIHLGPELTTVMVAMQEQGVAPERLGPFLANLTGLAGVRLYRAAELGADWITSGQPPEGG